MATSFGNPFKTPKTISSVTNLVDILTGDSYADDTYDGIPDLVESIDIQHTGPAEASRAIKKKLKHGSEHQKYRAIVILNALVENGSPRMKTGLFEDVQLTDALRNMATDPGTDKKVRKKLTGTLRAWHSQYKDEPTMKTAANLYKPSMSRVRTVAKAQVSKDEALEATKRKDKDAERERKKAGAGKLKHKQKTFNFEEEKPKILTNIASATQAANNLVNAITLVNRENDTLERNLRVQECLRKLKQEQKPIFDYIHLVNDDNTIGTLIETNDRMVVALEMYDNATSGPGEKKQDDVENVRKDLASVEIEGFERTNAHEKRRARSEERVHPDLQDLNFGELGDDNHHLPPPLRPNTRLSSSDEEIQRGSLSDYSDYESSNEQTHGKGSRNAPSTSNNYSGRHVYPETSDFDVAAGEGSSDDNPFADPFGDNHEVDPR